VSVVVELVRWCILGCTLCSVASCSVVSNVCCWWVIVGCCGALV